jgi:hypothetical protein
MAKITVRTPEGIHICDEHLDIEPGLTEIAKFRGIALAVNDKFGQ